MSKRRKRRGGKHRTAITPGIPAFKEARPSNVTRHASFRPRQICGRGHITLSPISIGSGSQNIELRGNVATCELCGEPAQIEDGWYSFIDGIVRIAKTSEDHTTLLKEMVRIAQQASSGELSNEQAHAEIDEALDPDGKKWWQRWRATNPRAWSASDWFVAKELLEDLQANLPTIAENVGGFLDGLLSGAS